MAEPRSPPGLPVYFYPRVSVAGVLRLHAHIRAQRTPKNKCCRPDLFTVVCRQPFASRSFLVSFAARVGAPSGLTPFPTDAPFPLPSPPRPSCRLRVSASDHPSVLSFCMRYYVVRCTVIAVVIATSAVLPTIPLFCLSEQVIFRPAFYCFIPVAAMIPGVI